MAGVDPGTTRERELQRLLDAVQGQSHIGTWEWTIATGEIACSAELYRIYGLEPAAVETTLELLLTRTHPSERERVQRELQAALRHPGPFSYRAPIVRPDGEPRTVETRGEAVTDEHGAVLKLVATSRDVTELVERDERLEFYSDVFEHVQVGLSGWQLDRAETPPTLRLVAFNAQTEVLAGTDLGCKLGRKLSNILPALDGSALLDAARNVTIGTPIRRFPPFARSASPNAPWLAATVFPMPGNNVGLALEDVTAQVRIQALHAAERRVLEMLAAGAPLEELLAAIVRAIERAVPGMIGSILLLDEAGFTVRGAAPGLPESYSALVEGLPIGPKAGSCGTAMYRKERVIVADIETDRLWEDFRGLARQYGLRACWSQPILGDNDRVLGAFALYHREPATPDAGACELLAAAEHVASIVLERRALDDEMRALAGRIEAVREEERTAIARDIHDQLGQVLTALKLDLGWLRRRITEQPLLDKLEEMSRSADEVIHSVRRIAADLRPGILDDLGLRAAIEWQAEEFEKRSGTRVTVISTVTDLQLERGLATNVFRIFQEALTNVARHASAQSVEVALALHGGQLRLELSDDGIGVPEIGPRGTTLGILGMRERAARFGGECTVKRREPRGTVVTVTVPLRFPTERVVDAHDGRS